MKINDPYAAWCLDQAMAEYAARRQKGHRIKPIKTQDNEALIRKMQRK